MQNVYKTLVDGLANLKFNWMHVNGILHDEQFTDLHQGSIITLYHVFLVDSSVHPNFIKFMTLATDIQLHVVLPLIVFY